MILKSMKVSQLSAEEKEGEAENHEQISSSVHGEAGSCKWKAFSVYHLT